MRETETTLEIGAKNPFLKGDQQMYHLQTSQRFDFSARHLSSTFLNTMPTVDPVQQSKIQDSFENIWTINVQAGPKVLEQDQLQLS